MNSKDFDEQEYLKKCLIRDMLRYKNRTNTYIDIVDSKNREIKDLEQKIEDLKYKCSKLEESFKRVKRHKKVRCVDKGYFDCLTEGKEYDVVGDDGNAYWYYKSRFEIVE